MLPRNAFLQPGLRKGMEEYFSQACIGGVKKTTDTIGHILQLGEYEIEICKRIANINNLNIESLLKLLSGLSFSLTGRDQIPNYTEKINMDLEIAGKNSALINVALQDMYLLMCIGKIYDIPKQQLLSIIMLNMRFSGAKSGGVSDENIAVHIIEEILGNPDTDKENLLRVLREKSSLDVSKFSNQESLETRKKGASCPLYAFKDSGNYIIKLWELVEIIFTVINLKFQSPQSKEELLLTGKIKAPSR